MLTFSPASTPIDAESGGLGYRSRTVASLREAGVPEADVLAAVRIHLKKSVDDLAEALRQRLITPGPGQTMEYQQAQAQAAAALKAPTTATAEKYPMLAASIGIDIDPSTGAPAEDVLGVARSVDTAFQIWVGYGAAIRAVRLSAKAAIDAAATVEAAAALLGTIPWPVPGASDATA